MIFCSAERSTRPNKEYVVRYSREIHDTGDQAWQQVTARGIMMPLRYVLIARNTFHSIDVRLLTVVRYRSLSSSMLKLEMAVLAMFMIVMRMT
ncbi:MAG TPA: hypothetical protein VK436_05760 [Methanocella sp.]|nr:hypothetical protein [Methanocella sp.]